MKRVIPLAILLALAGTSVTAGSGEWTDVEALRVGARVGVVSMGLARVEGEVSNVTPRSITVHADRDFTIARENVVRVYVRPSFSRKKRILAGAAAGLAVGGVIAAGVGKGSSGEGFFGGNRGGAAAGLAAGGAAGIGAVAGAASGGGYRTVYQRR